MSPRDTFTKAIAAASKNIGQPALRGQAAIGNYLSKGPMAYTRKENLQFKPEGTFQESLYGTNKPFGSKGEALGASLDLLPGGTVIKPGLSAAALMAKSTSPALKSLYKNALVYSKQIPTKDIHMTDEAIETYQRVRDGAKSRSGLPLFSVLNPRNQREIEDGKHRFAQALLRGEKHVNVIENPSVYKELAAQEERLLLGLSNKEKVASKIRSYLRNGAKVRGYIRGANK